MTRAANEGLEQEKRKGFLCSGGSSHWLRVSSIPQTTGQGQGNRGIDAPSRRWIRQNLAVATSPERGSSRFERIKRSGSYVRQNVVLSRFERIKRSGSYVRQNVVLYASNESNVPPAGAEATAKTTQIDSARYPKASVASNSRRLLKQTSFCPEIANQAVPPLLQANDKKESLH